MLVLFHKSHTFSKSSTIKQNNPKSIVVVVVFQTESCTVRLYAMVRLHVFTKKVKGLKKCNI